MKMIRGSERFDARPVYYKKEGNALFILDQRLIPHTVKFIECHTAGEVAKAIKDMAVRGAPAIGVAAAWGMAIAALQGSSVEEAAKVLKASRPTAHDLFYAVDWMMEEIGKSGDPDGVIAAARRYENGIIDRCRRIGEHGAKLIKDGTSVLTHCNAGALATIEYGTALAPIRIASQQGRNVFVFVDETRPWLQGSRLTAWELLAEDIPFRIIADNAAGYFMWRGDINMVITGADRVTASGDAANKIGTYEKAVVAHETGIPFYIAVPLSTYDPNTATGRDIPIEERAEEEVLTIQGTRIAPEGAGARNPSFDVIPAKYITGYITEYGIYTPEEIGAAFREHGL